MTKLTTNSKSWIKPEVKRLGEIKDVAGVEVPNAQAAGNVKS